MLHLILTTLWLDFLPSPLDMKCNFAQSPSTEIPMMNFEQLIPQFPSCLFPLPVRNDSESEKVFRIHPRRNNFY